MEALVLAVGVVGVIAMVKKTVDIVTWLTNGEWDAVLKTVVAIVVSVGLMLLLAATNLADKVVVIPGNDELGIAAVTLDTLNDAAVIYIGIMLGFIATFGVDIFKVFDNTRSSATGNILSSPPEG